MDGKIVWINGPFRGSKNDLAIYRRGLMARIPPGKRVIADRGYRGEPDTVDIPNPLESKEIKDFKSMILARHETANTRFKDWGILSQAFRHVAHCDPLKSHEPFFYAIAVITVVKLEHGEDLFNVYIE